jgi:diaminohydroxyphosphoribosylaminopyrimidine deaminase/5-amino-6-(5-phosphoribosylamino)uracil reductase
MAGGAKLLADAGIEVITDVMVDECTALNPSWTFAHEQARPWVIWKTATTLDGFIAAADGTSKWITGEEAREFVQRIRSTVGAIVTGTGTVLADDPHLTVRALPADQQPLRVVVGNRSIPDDANVLKSGAQTIQTSDDVAEVISALWREYSIHRVLVEAGSGLSTSLWRAGLVDEVYWFQAPAIAGDGIKALADIGVQSMAEVLRFSQTAVNHVGLDVVVHFTTRQD